MTRHRLDVAALHHAMDAVRARRGVSWRAVAREIGVGPMTLTRLGQGHRPDADGLCSMLAWLGLPLDRFIVARQS